MTAERRYEDHISVAVGGWTGADNIWQVVSKKTKTAPPICSHLGFQAHQLQTSD